MIRVGLIVLSLAALSDSFAASARPAGRQIVSRSARNTPVVQCGAVFSRNTSFMSSDEGVYVVCPRDAQLSLLFLFPLTPLLPPLPQNQMITGSL